MESFTSIASFEGSGRLTIWSTVQNPFVVRDQIAELFHLPLSRVRIVSQNIGGAYGDKKNAMDRFCDNFSLLPDYVKKRLTVENDDRNTLYSVKDLYYGVYEKIGVPIVFDFHHHKFCNGGISEKEALNLAVSTWGDVKPVVHYSESRSIEKNDDTIKAHAHSDYVYDYINTYGINVDVMIEAKCKELAVLKYLEKHGR